MNNRIGTGIPPVPHALPPTPDVANTEWGETNEREALHYDAETNTYWAKLGSHPECVALEVVSAVATVSNTEPLKLPPVYYDIGSDAHDALVDLMITEAALGEMHVSVTYVDYEVTVHADGIICIRPPPEESTKAR
ncbi:HalOD1 output domain-containing protein [Halobacterium wangiae]|uniref:HalOD1 output domain-containing protein n=1 Tax=Halobacterium wangiae TaxID=2902623 RepID=UPI001E3720FE|nr:HalOD1 output domain-containing protein [Halobacterium wangiae]